MKVKDQYNIDEEILIDKEGVSDFWDNANNFWFDVKNEHISEMSEAQINFLEKIEEQTSMRVW